MNDTIAAVATALGVGAIAIIRVSGDEAISKVASIFDGKDLNKVPSHTIHYGHIVDNSEVIDEVLITVMRAPKTYTKEDVVEINTHGGIATTKKVLEVLLSKNVRLALPGEFSKRAFLNGRIDLMQAEAISNLINSETQLERKLAINQVQGNLSKKIKEIRNSLMELMANIEVNIDFPEYEEAIEITHNNIIDYLDKAQKELERLVANAQVGKLIEQGIKVAIVGRPNVGKSSLLNTLLNENKAIVTDIAGTTRDLVEGYCELAGIKLKFIDTAGIRDTSDVVEQIGVDKSIEALRGADLIILVVNYNEKLTKEDIDIINRVKDKKVITLVNKNDLKGKIDIDDLKTRGLDNIILGNTINLEGIESLKQEIIKLFNLDNIETNNLEIISNIRVVNLIKDALKSIENAKEATKGQVPIDMVAIDIKKAWECLGEITGEVYQDELLDTLFSKFCLGK